MALDTQVDDLSVLADPEDEEDTDTPATGLWPYCDLRHPSAPAAEDAQSPEAFREWLGSKSWHSRGAVSNAPVRLMRFGNEYTSSETRTLWIGHHSRDASNLFAAGVLINLNRSRATINGRSGPVWYPEVVCTRVNAHDLDVEKVSVALWQMVLYDFDILIRKDTLELEALLNRRFTTKTSSRVPFDEVTAAALVVEDEAGGRCQRYTECAPGQAGYRSWERAQGATKYEAQTSESVRRYFWMLSAARNSSF